MVGSTTSIDGDITINHGGNDIWLLKTDTFGNIQFQKTYGGSDDDIGASVIQALDGGYAVAGYTYSNDGDVSGNHGGPDCWVFKVDNSGALQWQICLGGADYDEAFSIIQNADSTYVVAGYGNTD